MQESSFHTWKTVSPPSGKNTLCIAVIRREKKLLFALSLSCLLEDVAFMLKEKYRAYLLYQHSTSWRWWQHLLTHSFASWKSFTLLNTSEEKESFLILRKFVSFFFFDKWWLGMMMEFICITLFEQALSQGHLSEDGWTCTLCSLNSITVSFLVWWSGAGNFSVQLVAHWQATCSWFRVWK